MLARYYRLVDPQIVVADCTFIDLSESEFPTGVELRILINIEKDRPFIDKELYAALHLDQSDVVGLIAFRWRAWVNCIALDEPFARVLIEISPFDPGCASLAMHR